MKFKSLIISALLIASLGVKGQGIAISFGDAGIDFPDTVTLGDTIHYSCWVVNDGQDVLAENIMLHTGNYSQTLGLTNTRIIGGQGPNYIFPGDSIQFVPGFLFEVVSMQNYQIGDNIVVIWPKVAIPVNQNTQYAYKDLYVLGPSIMSTMQQNNSKGVHIYPQPARNNISFTTTKTIQSIEIDDLLGRKVLSILHPSPTIDVSELLSGMYLIRLDFLDGGYLHQKIKIQH